MSPDVVTYGLGLLSGLALGVPVGLLLSFRIVPAVVDRVHALRPGHDRRA